MSSGSVTLSNVSSSAASRKDVFAALVTGEEIEDYPDGTPFPSALFLHWTGDQSLHVVAALDLANELAFIVTAYRPDRADFEPDFKTRRKQ